jgi:hypothetical protein
MGILDHPERRHQVHMASGKLWEGQSRELSCGVRLCRLASEEVLGCEPRLVASDDYTIPLSKVWSQTRTVQYQQRDLGLSGFQHCRISHIGVGDCDYICREICLLALYVSRSDGEQLIDKFFR